MAAPPDPYLTLGVPRSASDGELRAAYRRLVLRHHPDHNGGSAESARRFEAVQEAYARVRHERGGADASGGTGGGGDRGAADATAPGATRGPGFDDRLAAMERELRAAREAKQEALRKAQHAAARRPPQAEPDRPSDEELGYYSTEDSFTKILDDVASEVSSRLSEAETQAAPVKRRFADLIDELGSKLTGEPPQGGKRTDG